MEKCIQCGEEYPDYFPECPSCGTAKPTPPKPPKRPIDFKNGIRGLVWITICGFLIFSFISYKLNAPAREAAERQKQEQQAIVKRENAEKRESEKIERDKIRAKETAEIAKAVDARQKVAAEKKSAIDGLYFKFRLNRPSPNTMAIEVAIRNNSNLGMKDFVVSCDLKGQSDSVIRTQAVTVFQELMPGKGVQPSPLPLGFVDPQVVTGECQVIDAKF